MIDKFTIVTGVNRTGTSAMMYALMMAGVPICGFKHPIEIGKEESLKIDGGTYVPLKANLSQANPNGF